MWHIHISAKKELDTNLHKRRMFVYIKCICKKVIIMIQMATIVMISCFHMQSHLIFCVHNRAVSFLLLL